MKQDHFGQDLQIGDYVLGANKHDIDVYMVTNITPKMVRIAKPGGQTRSEKKGVLRYAWQVYKITPELATFQILKTK